LTRGTALRFSMVNVYCGASSTTDAEILNTAGEFKNMTRVRNEFNEYFE